MELHVLLTGHQTWGLGAARLSHTERRTDGTWSDVADVTQQVLDENPGSPDPGSFSRIAAAGVQGELHFCGIATSGEVWHTIRRANGTWFPFTNVNAATRAPLATIEDIAVTDRGSELDVCAAAVYPGLDWHYLAHAVRRVSGWDPIEYVPASPIRQIDLASAGGQFHLCGVDHAGELLHAIAGFPWLTSPPWGNVRSAILSLHPASPDPGPLQLAACCGIGTDLHVVALDGGGTLWHTMRLLNGTWSEFANVPDKIVFTNLRGATRIPLHLYWDPGPSDAVGCAAIGDELHVVGHGSARPAALGWTAQAGWHTIRQSDGTWLPFVEFQREIVMANPLGGNPGQGIVMASAGV